MTPTFTITNRHGLKLVAEILSPATPPIGSAVVMHGLTGSRTQKHVYAVAKMLTAAGYTTLVFSAANHGNESGGDTINLTPQSQLEDLEDAVRHVLQTSMLHTPIILAGFSIGANVVIHYAAKHAKQVAALLPFCPIISAEVRFAASAWSADPNFYPRWQQLGYWDKPDKKDSPNTHRLSWNYVASMQQHHDCTRLAPHLSHPVLMCSGTNDSEVLPKQVADFFALFPPNPKNELHILAGASHNFNPAEIIYPQLEQIIHGWLKKI